MFTAIVIGALSASALLQQTDTIVDAGGARRLSLENFRGEVVVRTWDRDQVRIVADHPSSRSIEIDQHGATLSVETLTDRGLGLAGSVDFELTVPDGMDLQIEGMAVDADVEGALGEVRVETINGSIRVVGGTESIGLSSVNGDIVLEGASGEMEITGVAGGVTIRDSEGDIVVDAVGGGITLQNVRSEDIEAGTVGGSLRFEGPIMDEGIYTFGSHGGAIWLYLPPDMNATVEAITLAGDIEIDFPGAPSTPSRGEGIPGLREKEVSFTTGNGGARIEVESFGGLIHILRAGSGGGL
jgi:DUF4097 and DUF4098 domain-containing protein YvlB